MENKSEMRVHEDAEGTVCHPTEADLPAVYENAVFLRPHHLSSWEWVNTDINGNFDKKTFIGWSMINHYQNAIRKKQGILSGKMALREGGLEIDVLHVFTSLTKEPLSEEVEKLRETRITPNTYRELSEKEADMYELIWAKPETTTVVITTVLDNQCRLNSEQGFPHCQLQWDNNYDDLTIQRLSALKNNPRVPQEIKDKITFVYSRKATEKVQAVIIPLQLLKNKNFIIMTSMM